MNAPKRPSLHATPEDAEAAFYEALHKGDTDALIAVWSDDEETVCVHPTGTQLIGLEPHPGATPGTKPSPCQSLGDVLRCHCDSGGQPLQRGNDGASM